MSDAGSAALTTRRGAGLFALDRGLISVAGRDRVRWLNGMVSADVATLATGPRSSGCYALLLTPKGGILADLHVLHDEERLRLELAAEATAEVLARLERYVVADDVTLADSSETTLRFALEGPGATELLGRAGCDAAADLAPDAWLPARIGEVPVDVAAWGSSGEAAYQLFVPAGWGDAVREALRRAAGELPYVEAGEDVLELLRIEAGCPRLGAELDEDVLPAEAHLTERAVSFTKGCYTGQEIVARIESRGRVNHLLVGLAFEAETPALGAPLREGERQVGEVTSVCVSPQCGAIGLGYVRRALAEPGTRLECEGGSVQVAALPFVAPGRS